tara:strand:+ start:57 stop:578 length:522 start_codon:yes stop_codon:yes gene_type:complete
VPNILILLIYILGGTALGGIMLLSGIPAAPLVGAILGAGLLSISGYIDVAQWPIGTKTALGIGVGTVIGTGINRDTLQELQLLWKPALLITFSLIITGIIVGIISSKFFGIEPLVALLGSAPGGTLGMSLVGAEFGVGAAVAALHAVRLITVLLLIPAIVKFLASFVGIDINQ